MVQNARSLATISRERLDVCGVQIWVATVDELLGMKRDTVSLYGAGVESSSRPAMTQVCAALQTACDQLAAKGVEMALVHESALMGWGIDSNVVLPVSLA